MAADPKDTRYFLTRASCINGNECAEYNAALLSFRQSHLKRLYDTYVKLLTKPAYKRDDILYIVLRNGFNLSFVKLSEDGVPNMAGLEPFFDGSWDKEWVEVPRDTFAMLEGHTLNDVLRTDYEHLHLDDSGFFVQGADHYCNDIYEFPRLHWTDLGLAPKRKGR